MTDQMIAGLEALDTVTQDVTQLEKVLADLLARAAGVRHLIALAKAKGKTRQRAPRSDTGKQTRKRRVAEPEVVASNGTTE